MVGYGYPVLALILFMGALGLPLPSGVATSIVGSLVARGELSWAIATLVATVASVLGDLAGYGVGRVAGPRVAERTGRWVGLPRARVAQAERLFDRWGGVSLLLTRTIMSGLSSPVSFLAGAAFYGPRRFLAYDLSGRLLWTLGYLGLGFAFERYASLVTDLLNNSWGLIVSLAIVAGTLYLLFRLRSRRSDGGRAHHADGP